LLFCGCVLGARALFSATTVGSGQLLPALWQPWWSGHQGVAGRARDGERKPESGRERESRSARGWFASARLHAMQLSIAREWVAQVVEVVSRVANPI